MKPEELYNWIESQGDLQFSRSAGPGGQNVNKTSTKVTLRLDIEQVPGTDGEKQRIAEKLGNRITTNGELVIHSSETRSQSQNRETAVRRAYELILSAAKKKKMRKRTKPTKASKEKRLEKKKQRGRTKKLRKDPEV
ncbi:MAG: alternative ribosome rescue aminoacyl-tRNA hydrolase ArfB [Spirochaetia bacterium]